MQIECRLFQIAMSKQDLDGAQIGAGFEQMRGEAMAQSVGMNGFVNAGPLDGFMTSVPGHAEADRISASVPGASWEQPLFRSAMQPSKVGS